MLDLNNKVALVTGCGSALPGWGNGKATAVLLARQGATVYGVDRNLEAAQVTASLIQEEGGTASVTGADVTNSQAVQALVDDCMQRYGRIDILVNNVGQSIPGGPVEISEEDWDAQFAVNMKSAYLMCKYVLPIMEQQQRGAVVNVSSVAGVLYAGKPQVGYASAKAAIIHFTRTTGVIYADKGVRMNCVVPGLIHTPLVERLANEYAKGAYDEFVEHRNQQVPMKRMGDAWDIANAILFLASDEAKYITGQSLIVDGGFTSATR